MLLRAYAHHAQELEGEKALSVEQLLIQVMSATRQHVVYQK